MNPNAQLTFFVNQASDNHFLLDTKARTLNRVTRSDVYVLSRYKHLMGFEGNYRTFLIPNIDTMKLFKKLIKNTDFTEISGDHAEYLVLQHPEYFI